MDKEEIGWGGWEMGTQCSKPCSGKVPMIQKLQTQVKSRVCQKSNGDNSKNAWEKKERKESREGRKEEGRNGKKKREGEKERREPFTEFKKKKKPVVHMGRFNKAGGADFLVVVVYVLFLKRNQRSNHWEDHIFLRPVFKIHCVVLNCLDLSQKHEGLTIFPERGANGDLLVCPTNDAIWCSQATFCKVLQSRIQRILKTIPLWPHMEKLRLSRSQCSHTTKPGFGPQ